MSSDSVSKKRDVKKRKGKVEDRSRNVGYHQMVNDIKYYFKKFGFYSMGNKT